MLTLHNSVGRREIVDLFSTLVGEQPLAMLSHFPIYNCVLQGTFER